MKTLKVRLTFTEPLLGTWPANQNVAREYIASKGPGRPPSRMKWPPWARMPQPTRR